MDGTATLYVRCRHLQTIKQRKEGRKRLRYMENAVLLVVSERISQCAHVCFHFRSHIRRECCDVSRVR